MALSDLIIKVGANIAEYTSALDTVVSKTGEAVDKVEARFSAFETVGASLMKVGAGLTAAVTVPLVGMASAAISAAVEFEAGMRKVSSLLTEPGVSAVQLEKDFKSLSAQTLEMSRAMGVDAVKASDALYQAISSGVPKENAVDFLKIASTAAIAGLTDTKVAVDGLTTVIQAFGLKSTETQNVADAMFQAVNKGKLEFPELASSIGLAAGTAAALHVNYKELLAASATLTLTTGQKVPEAMTMLQSAMKAIIEPTKEMEALIAKTGYSSGAAMVKALGLEQSLVAINTAAGGSIEPLAKAYGRVEGLRGALGLTGVNAQLAADHLASMTESAGAAGRAFAEIDKSTARQFERLTVNLKDTAIELGTALLPAVNALLNAVKPLASTIGEIVEWFTKLPGPAQATIGMLAGLAAAAGPLLLAIGGIAFVIPSIMAGLTAMAGVAGLAVGPFLAIAAGVAVAVAALVGLGVWVYNNWTPIKTTVLQAWDGLTELWGAIWNPTVAFLEGIWNSIASAASAAWSGIATLASAVWGPVVSFFTTLWNPIAPYFTATWNAIGSVLSSVWNGIKHAAETVWNAVVGAIDGFLKWAAKIPGVNKLFTLDEAWSNATKLAGETKKATDAVVAHVAVQKTVAPVIANNTGKIATHTAAVEKVHAWYTKWGEAEKNHAIRTYETGEAMDKAQREMGLLNQQISKGEGPLEDLTRALAGAAVEVDRMMPGMDSFNRVMAEMARQTASSADALGDAFKRQRITSSTELKATADQAVRDLETIRAAHGTTRGEVDAAWRAMMEAEIAYRKSLGDNVVPLEAELAKYDNAHKNLQKKTLDTWDEIRRGVNAAIDDFGRNMSNLGRDLLSGDFSLSKLSDAFKQLGLDIAQTFLDIGAKAITTFIKEHIGALLKAIGSVIDKIPGIGSALGGALGSAGTAIGGATGAVGATPPFIGPTVGMAGGAGTAPAGGAVGASGSALSTALGFAQLGVSVVSGIVQGFQMAHMNDTLKMIEESTRYSKAFLYGLVVQALDHWPQISNIRDYLWTVGHDADVEMIAASQDTALRISWLTDVAGDTRALMVQLRDYATATFEIIRDEIVTRLSGTNQVGESVFSPVLDTAGLTVDTSALGSVIGEAIDRLGTTLSQAKFTPANITLAPTIDASGQMSTMNNTLAGISMMMARGLGLTAPKGGEFEFISPSIVSAISRAENAVVNAVASATRYLGEIATSIAQPSMAIAGGVTINLDLRGATVSGNDAVDRLARQITDRIRTVVR